jgi:L-asparaginase II
MLASTMLARAGRDVETLECGAHWSSSQKVLIHQVRTMEKPTALHNNCSGKHAGFVCACCHRDVDPKGYVGYEHPLQQEIRGTMESLTGAALGHDNCGTDGCSIPTYAVPLRGLAHGFAKMATGNGLEPLRAKASRRLLEACMAEPFYVAGTGRACTALMQVAPGRIFAKTGAEGVFCAAVPEAGIAIAVKCDDGHSRAAEVMVAAALARFFEKDGPIRAALKAMATVNMHNWNGINVGDIRAAAAMMA